MKAFSKTYSLWFALLALFFYSPLHSQILDPSRCISWNPGIPEKMPFSQRRISVTDFGAKGDGETDDSPAFLSALEMLQEQGGGILFVPQGIYRIENGLRLGNGIWIQGEGAEKTVLEFDLNGRFENCIEIGFSQEENWIPVEGEIFRNQRTIEIKETPLFSFGDWIELCAENDSSILYTNPDWNQTWAQRAIGQILRIQSVKKDRIELTGPVFLDYPSHWHPKIRRLDMVMYSGIEKCRIERLDSGSGDSIVLQYSAYCQIREIESAFTTGIHVYLYGSAHCEIRDSFFHHAHDYGEGGHGYGVDCAHHATENLIENNIFEALRHAMVVQVGACGNVFGYNYSVNPISSDGIPLPDLVLHGHYPNYNLFESNVIQHIGVGDYWGPAGPGNTFFRNIVEFRGMDIEDHSHAQNVIGNGFLQDGIRIHPSVNGTLLYGNWVPSQNQEEMKYPLPVSYYLFQKPEYFGESPWPLIKDETPLDYDELPAKQRYKQNQHTISSHRNWTRESLSLSVYPNPAFKKLYAEFFVPASGSVSLVLFDTLGRRVFTVFNGFLERGYRIWPIDLPLSCPLASGVYILRLRTKTSQFVQKVVIL